MLIRPKKILAAGVAAITLASAVATSATPVQAQYAYAPRGAYGHSGYHAYRPYREVYHHRRRSNGGAVAAGIIGGLALGALAASAARPAYAPAYGVPAYGGCTVERRRVVNRWGNVVIRDVETCY